MEMSELYLYYEVRITTNMNTSFSMYLFYYYNFTMSTFCDISS